MPETEKSEKTAAPIARKAAVAEPPAPPAADPVTEGPMDSEEYERLLDMYDVSFKNFAEGEVVKGVVLQVSESEVIVDVGYKSEGIIPIEEFRDETGQLAVKRGDLVDVLLEKTEDKEGYVVLSKEKAEKMKVWDDVERAYQERRVVTGRVIERVKGGLAVDIGVRAFLPGSQVDIRPVRNLDSLKGPGAPDARHQGQQEARQHRPLPQGGPRRGERRAQDARPWRRSRRARSSWARSRTSPSTARSWTWAGSTACSTSRTCPGAASTTRARS